MKKKVNIVSLAALMLCGSLVAGSSYIYRTVTSENKNITASADENEKEFKFAKRAVVEGTTVNAEYLWPEETDAEITSVYRDGRSIEDKMVTIAPGSVYHFRGMSADAVLYTEVYVGIIEEIDVTQGETGTWYRLLPSAIRKEFEDGGWTWETGWEYTGRAYLDTEHKRVMIKNDDVTAVLYGIGLYLDDKYGYSQDKVFKQESEEFTHTFDETDNIFASAMEYYYSKGGELNSKCPDIYSKISDIMSDLDIEIELEEETEEAEDSETMNESDEAEESETAEEDNHEPKLMEELLSYANLRREQAGLNPVAWDTANNDNIIVRVQEASISLSQTRPDGSDAFTAYTDSVMCEIRLSNISDIKDIFNSAESYFLRPDVKSFNCGIYENIGILIFTW